MVNYFYEPNPFLWPNLTNFLFTKYIRAPYTIVYRTSGKTETYTVVLKGITRGEKYKSYRKLHKKREMGLTMDSRNTKPVIYRNAGNGIGVLTINSFWGKRIIPLLLGNAKDRRFKRLMKNSIKKITNDGIENLIIDLTFNGGGMADNIYYTLDYLTDKTIRLVYKYSITDESREIAKTVISNESFLKKEDREFLINYIDSVPAGSKFRTDTIRTIEYVPQKRKYSFDGNIYILTSNYTYSAAQVFTEYCQTYGIAQIAGEHCGGYNEITGNSSRMELPLLGWYDFNIPYMAYIIDPTDEPYQYPEVDIPIVQPFEEWLQRENHNVERLIEIILGNDSPKDTQKCYKKHTL